MWHREHHTSVVSWTPDFSGCFLFLPLHCKLHWHSADECLYSSIIGIGYPQHHPILDLLRSCQPTVQLELWSEAQGCTLPYKGLSRMTIIVICYPHITFWPLLSLCPTHTSSLSIMLLFCLELISKCLAEAFLVSDTWRRDFSCSCAIFWHKFSWPLILQRHHLLHFLIQFSVFCPSSGYFGYV